MLRLLLLPLLYLLPLGLRQLLVLQIARLEGTEAGTDQRSETPYSARGFSTRGESGFH